MTQSRFAALRRISTEAQEKEEESLQVQTADIARAVARLGGEIAEWYGGQEHAAQGHERKELERLLQDAKRGRFNAFIVAHAGRWSRDNFKSDEGLKVFQANGVRLFVGDTELNLCDPSHRLFLEMSRTIGKFNARNHRKKSYEFRIERTKNKNAPASGNLPFRRVYEHLERQ